ncbi:hypothetical protein, partial [Mesorhizobium sp.]|uniref:hypothetical protein n=1 Tax=Mesorhizobium sp. TaxID=1871066 RepID=UPI0025F06F27
SSFPGKTLAAYQRAAAPTAGRCNDEVALTVVVSGLVTRPLSAILGMGYDSVKTPASNHVARINAVDRILLIVHYFSCA